MRALIIMAEVVLVALLCCGNIQAQHAGMVSMDFDNVDIKVLIKYMSELTGKNFIVDSAVAGKVTVISPTKVSLDEAYKVLESILIVNGYTTVPSENMIKVIPLGQAKQLDIETHVGKEVEDSDLKDRVITQIIPLECADPEKLQAILNPYISGAGHIASYTPTSTLIITDVSSNLTKLLQITRDLDQPAVSGPEKVHVYNVQNGDSVNMAKILNQVYLEQRQQSQKEVIAQPPTIVADGNSNSIIILTSPQEYAFMLQLLKKLDKRKSQVLVEALIAEVTMEKSLELGLELAAAGGIVYGSSRGFAGAKTQGMVKNILTGDDLENNALGVVEGTTNVGGVTMPNLGLLITASQNDDGVNLISAPHLLATDNQEARIMIGENLAFIKNVQVTAEGGTVRTFEYRDVGLLLKLIPHITEDNYVRMDVVQEVQNVIGQSFAGAVETSKREAVTTVTVKDNATVVIGGLIVDREIESVEKVPLLGDIPLVGLIFRRTKKESKKMNLFIFITPHIIRDEEDLARITTEKQDKVKR